MNIISKLFISLIFFISSTGGGSASQCNGLANTVYPGTGTNVACAWSNPMIALPSPTFGTPRIAGGDTLIVARGKYPIRRGSPGSEPCGNNIWDCNLGVPPAGTPSNPTRILGEGWDKRCMRPPTLLGGGPGGMDHVVNLINTHDVVFACFEITDPSDCIPGYEAKTGRCGNTQVDTFAKDGIRISDTVNLVIRNLNIHGMGAGGITFGRNQDFLAEDIRISANGWVGISGDLDGNTLEESINTGSIVFRRVLIEWSGCRESIPGNKPFGCWAEPGWGDGVGFDHTYGDFLWEDCTFRYNTSDGLDMLYHDGEVGDVVVRRARSEGNAGNQLKVQGKNVTIENSIVIANCNFFDAQPYTMHVEHNCRADGVAITAVTKGGESSTIKMINNTVIGNGDSAINTSSTNATVIVKNTIMAGSGPSYLKPGQPMAGLLTYDNPGVVITDHNILWNIHNAGCGIQGDCVDPMFVNFSMKNADLRLRPGSPAINAGTASGAPTTDFFKVPRTARGGIDIGALELP